MSAQRTFRVVRVLTATYDVPANAYDLEPADVTAQRAAELEQEDTDVSSVLDNVVTERIYVSEDAEIPSPELVDQVAATIHTAQSNAQRAGRVASADREAAQAVLHLLTGLTDDPVLHLEVDEDDG